jgi:hypothetical protein
MTISRMVHSFADVIIDLVILRVIHHIVYLLVLL